MNTKSKLAAIAVVAAVSVAAPALAFAQALQTGTAANREQLYGYSPAPNEFVPYYGNGLRAYAEVPGVIRHAPRSYRGLGRLHHRSRHGLRALDMVPGPAFGSESPSSTGGGSIGYNAYNGRDS